MKIYLICTAFWISCSFAFAQIGAGKIYLSGVASINHQAVQPLVATEFRSAQTQLRLYTNLGLFVNDLTSLEVGIGNSTTWSKTSSPNLPLDMQRSSINTFQVELGARFYFKNESEHFKLFLRPYTNYAWSDTKNGIGKSNSFTIGLSPNMNYFFSKKFALEFGFSGIGFSTSRQISQKSTAFQLGASSLIPNLGIIYFLK